MTREEFLERYAARSGVSVQDLLRLGQVPVRCSCSDPLCLGWAMFARDLLHFHLDRGFVPPDLSETDMRDALGRDE